MGQQRSEDRVVPEGGAIPAERAWSSHGAQRKAVPVEETAVRVSRPIASAANPRGATRRRSPDRVGEIRAGGRRRPSMPRRQRRRRWEVAYRLTGALLKVASSKGATGPAGQATERCVSSGRPCCPGYSRRAGGGVPAR